MQQAKTGTQPFTIAIVGLGLMGGSLAHALKGFRDACLIGADTDVQVCRQAVRAGVVSSAHPSPDVILPDADLVLFCTPPHAIPELLRACAALCKPSVLLCDICGVKSPLYREIEAVLPKPMRYIGIHPMAGKEVGGFTNADGALFVNTGFIIIPTPRTVQEDVVLMRALARHIGVAHIAQIEPKTHDDIIGYTSDLMHIASAALCMDMHPGMTPAFTAGAFRDCTRVADIDASLWTELLMVNRTHTLAHLDRYINRLTQVYDALFAEDEAGLHALLLRAGDNKRRFKSL